MDKVRALEAFVAVVDTGTFTRAAELLKLPKATVSTAIQDLETQLGVRLLHRTTRKVTVTADGAAYYERCVRILDDLREADEAVSNRDGCPSGKLRVDMVTSMASHLMAEGLQDFMAKCPDVVLEVGCSDRPVNLINEGVDCAIRVGQVSDPSLIARRIGSMRFVTCASPAYLAAHGVPQHPQDLRKHRCINYFALGRTMPWDFVRGEERIELSLEGLSINDSNVYEDACVAGAGVGQIPSFAFHARERAGELALVLGEWQTESLPIHVIYPSRRHLSTKVQAFVEWAAEHFENSPGLRRD